MNMRKNYITLLALIGFVFFCQEVKSQQAPQYTQYYENQLGVNPAYAGLKNRICVTAMHRDQWRGFEGSPETNVLTIHSNLNNSYVQGIGLHVLDDNLGPLTNRALGLSLSHRLTLGPGELGIGLNVGGFQRSLGEADWRPPLDPVSMDPTIPDEEGSSFVPDFGFGLHYSTSDWFVGLSSQHLHEPQFDDWGGSENKIFRTYYLMGGYSYPLTQNITLQPKTLLKADRSKLQADFTGTVRLGDRLWGGATYRYEDAVALHVGMRLIDDLRVGYSYDITTSEMSDHSDGTHEFMLSYCFRITVREDRPIEILTPRFL